MDIQGKVVVITGASAGIGAATALALAARHAKVVLAARSVDKLTALVEDITSAGGEALALSADMRQPADITAMIAQARQHFGQIDVLVNNAGQALGGPIEALNLEDYQQVLELNVFGVLRAMQAVVPIMRAQGGGLILNISSMTSKMAIPGIGGYASTKYALNGLSMTARAELAKDNIRVILVYPRLTATAFVDNGRNYRNHGVARPAGAQRPPGVVVDTAEHVANKIAEAILNEPAEQFME